MFVLQLDFLVYFLIFVVLLVLIQVYFRIADRFNVVDKPNHRSSHTTLTIRGGGIIFPIAFLVYCVGHLVLPVFLPFEYPFFLIGLLLISLISFVDDVKPVSNRLRILIHLVAAGLLFFQLGILSMPLYVILILLFVTIGTINAINFMDGINGITGGYAFITLLSLLFLNEVKALYFSPTSLIVTTLIAVVVFNIYNFRTKAKCFAGDVGSVSISFILLFFIGQLIIQTGQISYILFLFLYGLDTATTIVFRLFRKERIFDAHRSHFYQFLVNERKIPHLYVASGYALIQLIFNIILISYLQLSTINLFFFLIVITGLFLALRFKMEGKNRLLESH
jgi:UDP-GlcNAc:undecaprenyl-phosphate GlcNAc-1-phosphate transferase